MVKHAPVLVRLADDVRNHENMSNLKRQIRKGAEQPTYFVASHLSICCFFNEPCVSLYAVPKIKNAPYHRVTVASMVRVLVHESIHHALEWMDGDPLDKENNDISVSFDEVFPTVADMGWFM
jgi:hypothetical protein